MACTFCKISFFEFHIIISNEQRLLTFLQEHEVLPKNVICPSCKKPCKFYPNDGFKFKCINSQLLGNNKHKKKRVFCNYTQNTFFENSCLSLNKICRFASSWLLFASPLQTLQYELEISSKMAVAWSNFCREVCLICMVDVSEPIGGPNKIVDIYEAKRGERKYNGGRLIEGQWVFGGIERESKKSFIVPVSHGGKDTLLDVVKDWVLPGTTIMSDCWESYNCLTDEGFQQETVNRSKNFVNLEVRDDNISQEDYFDGDLVEYQFSLKYSNHTHRFHYFFKSMGQVYPPTALDTEDSSGSSD